MFGEPLYAWSQHVRAGGPQILSEGVATFGCWRSSGDAHGDA
jgi:hypothetical protein